MDNILVLDKIASFLPYNDLKNCRLVNKLLNQDMTRHIRLAKKTQALIDSMTLPLLMSGVSNSEAITWDSVRIDWDIQDAFQGSELSAFFTKFGAIIKGFSWEGAATNSNWTAGFGKELLASKDDEYDPTRYVFFNLVQVVPKDVTSSLSFGPHAICTLYDLSFLSSAEFKLKSFSFAGYFLWSSSRSLGSLIVTWGETLETLRLTGKVWPTNSRIGRMPRLKTILQKCMNLKSLTVGKVSAEDAIAIFKTQPNLEHLSFIFDMSAPTFTGINSKMLAALGNRFVDNPADVQTSVASQRTAPSICNLLKLRELNITGGQIENASIMFGIAHLKELCKLTVHHSISVLAQDYICSKASPQHSQSSTTRHKQTIVKEEKKDDTFGAIRWRRRGLK